MLYKLIFAEQRMRANVEEASDLYDLSTHRLYRYRWHGLGGTEQKGGAIAEGT